VDGEDKWLLMTRATFNTRRGSSGLSHQVVGTEPSVVRQGLLCQPLAFFSPRSKMPMPPNGEVKGSLDLTSEGSIAAEDILKFHPELKTHTDAILKQGWSYACVEATGKAISRVTAESSRYWLGAAPAFMKTARAMKPGNIPTPEFGLVVYLGTGPPEVQAVPEVQSFLITISTKSLPAAVSVDIVKAIVTNIPFSFWNWEKDWESDKKKLADAREIYKIVTWLVDDQEFKLAEVFKPERYQELVETFRALPQQDAGKEDGQESGVSQQQDSAPQSAEES